MENNETNKTNKELNKIKFTIAVTTIVSIIIISVITAILMRHRNSTNDNTPSEQESITTVNTVEPSTEASEETGETVAIPMYNNLFGAWASEDKKELLLITGEPDGSNNTIRIINDTFRDYGANGFIDEEHLNFKDSCSTWQVCYKYDKDKDELNIMYNYSSEDEWNEEHSLATKAVLKRIDLNEFYELAKNFEFPAIEWIEDAELRFINNEITEEVQYQELKETMEFEEVDKEALNYLESDLEYTPEKCGLSVTKEQMELITRNYDSVVHYSIIENDNEKLNKTYEDTIDFIKSTYGSLADYELETENTEYSVHYIVTNYFETLVVKTNNAVISCYEEIHKVGDDEYQLTPIAIMELVLEKVKGVQ